jgi:heme-degrading monooxygenase HmoA
MIVRSWRGRASISEASAYPEHFRTHVLPELSGIEGFLGASLMQRQGGSEIEFLVLTRWSSMEAVRAFAGDDPSVAVVADEARRALVSFDTNVQHYEVLEDVRS